MSYATIGSYREMEILAMSPARRVVFLYSHLLVNLRQAHMHLEAGEIEARTERLLKAEEIVYELAASLNHEQGGQLADLLNSLYGWLLDGLRQSHGQPDLARLDALISTVSELHQAFSQAAAELETFPVSQLQGVS